MNEVTPQKTSSSTKKKKEEKKLTYASLIEQILTDLKIM